MLVSMFWITGAYLVGSIAGYRMGRFTGLKRGQVDIVNKLMHAGYLKFKTAPNGDMEIIKFNEKAD